MDYMHATQELVKVNTREVYPGQNAELLAMASAAGCDIHQHVPTLVRYGQQAESIIEMGVRFGWSTRSFLFARPKTMTSVDKFPWGSIHQSGGNPQPGNYYYDHYAQLYRGVVDYKFTLGDSTKIAPIPSVDLLFIDTFHHRDCLALELARHGSQAKKFIILHDTECFGENGQADASKLFFDEVTTSTAGTGLWYAIKPWLVQHPEWSVREHFSNCNGLTILAR